MRNRCRAVERGGGAGVRAVKQVMSLTQIILCTFSVTQSLFVLGLWWSSDDITASIKQSSSKKEPTSVSEITI